jgi:hypothetical protein
MARSLILAVALLVGAAGILEAQNRSSGSRQTEAGPIHTLLEMRSELRLRPEQMAELQRIDAETEQLNQPHVASLRDIRDKVRKLGPPDNLSPDGQTLFESYMLEARPLWERIRANNWEAMRRVGRVLSRWQIERMERLLKESVNRNRERNGHFPAPSERGQ